MASGARPVIGHALEFLRDHRRLLERGYTEHGEIFRLRLGGRTAVFLLGQDLARWYFKETDHSLLIGPSLAFTADLFGPDLYYLADPEEYQRQRQIGLPLFRGTMAAGHLAIMERRCAQFTARLGSEGTFDLPSEMNDLVLGVLMEALVGDDFVRRMPPTTAQGLPPLHPRRRIRSRRRGSPPRTWCAPGARGTDCVPLRASWSWPGATALWIRLTICRCWCRPGDSMASRSPRARLCRRCSARSLPGTTAPPVISAGL